MPAACEQRLVGDEMTPTNRWQQFRTSEDVIPSTPYEAGVFLQNARLHLIALYGHAAMEARLILVAAHERVNNHFFDAKEVA
jgi:hypothetical protein